MPKDSPLRRAHPLYWSIRTNDEGCGNPEGFFALVNEGKLDLIAPARAKGYGEDGKSVKLSDGRTIQAEAVVLATGYRSSWKDIFDGMTPF